MQQCLIYDNSLRFCRASSGSLAVLAFLIQSQWLVLAVGLLVVLNAFSRKFDVFYQFHVLVLRRLLKEKSEPILKESGELNFVSGMAGSLFLIGFVLLYFGKFISFAWALILLTSFLILLACFTGVCVASLMYAGFKAIFKK